MDISEDEVLSAVNIVLQEAGIGRKLTSIRQCTKIQADGKIWSGASVNESIRCQTIINTLNSLLPPEVSLTHIKGNDIAKGDLLNIKNLIDIFAVLLCLPFAKNEEENSEDSNLLSDEGIKVVNEVLTEELGVKSLSLQTESLLASSPFSVVNKLSQDSHISYDNLFTPPKHKPLPRELSDSHLSTPVSCNLFVPPIHQSTPHQGPKSRVIEVGITQASPVMKTPPLSISTISNSTESIGTTRGETPLSGNQTPLSRDETPLSRNQTPLSRNQTPLLVPNEVLQVSIRTQTEQRKKKEEEEEEEQNECERMIQIEGSPIPVDVSNHTPSHSVKPLPRDVIINTLYHNYISKVDRVSKRDSKVKRSTSIKGKHTPVTYKKSQTTAISRQLKTPKGSVLAAVQNAFPNVYCSPTTERRLWQQQMRQMNAQISTHSLANPAEKKAEEIQKRHNALLSIIKKELDISRRKQAISEQKQQKHILQASIRNQRLATARAKRYFNEYEIRVRDKLQKRRVREELIYRRTFEECLKLQKEKVREMRKYTKEKQVIEIKKHEDELQSLENFYRDRLVLLAESIEKEQIETKVREKDQKQVVDKNRRVLRQNMEDEITNLWSCLDDWEKDNIHFRELDKHLLQERLFRGSKT